MLEKTEMQFVPIDKKMSNGMRKFGNRPLTYAEIEVVKKEIHRICADESVFVFNDKDHLIRTCYNSDEDKVYVGCDVFPDTEYGSVHPRDLMSVGAVLAHEYYGHRAFREEYLKDEKSGSETTPEWQDECRASLTAAQKSPGLTQIDRANLIQDAIFRAKEFGQKIKMDAFMQEVLYGYGKTEKYFTKPVIIEYVSEKSNSRDAFDRKGDNDLPKVRKNAKRSDNRNVRTKGSRSL